VVHNATGRGPLLLRGAPELRPPLETDVFSRSELRDDNGLSVQRSRGIDRFREAKTASYDVAGTVHQSLPAPAARSS